MAIADERILEFLAENGNHQPSQITDRLAETGSGMSYHRKYIGRRCRQLTENGLLDNLGNGVYRITEDGERYLSGELDASQMEG